MKGKQECVPIEMFKKTIIIMINKGVALKLTRFQNFILFFYYYFVYRHPNGIKSKLFGSTMTIAASIFIRPRLSEEVVLFHI